MIVGLYDHKGAKPSSGRTPRPSSARMHRPSPSPIVTALESVEVPRLFDYVFQEKPRQAGYRPLSAKATQQPPPRSPPSSPPRREAHPREAWVGTGGYGIAGPEQPPAHRPTRPMTARPMMQQSGTRIGNTGGGGQAFDRAGERVSFAGDAPPQGAADQYGGYGYVRGPHPPAARAPPQREDYYAWPPGGYEGYSDDVREGSGGGGLQQQHARSGPEGMSSLLDQARMARDAAYSAEDMMDRAEQLGDNMLVRLDEHEARLSQMVPRGGGMPRDDLQSPDRNRHIPARRVARHRDSPHHQHQTQNQQHQPASPGKGIMTVREGHVRSEALRRSVAAIESLSAVLEETNAEKKVLASALELCSASYESTGPGGMCESRLAQATYITQVIPGCDRTAVDRCPPLTLKALEGALRLRASHAELATRVAEAGPRTKPAREEREEAVEWVKDENSRLKGEVGRLQQAVMSMHSGKRGGEGAGLVLAQMREEQEQLKREAGELRSELDAAREEEAERRFDWDREMESIRGELQEAYEREGGLRGELEAMKKRQNAGDVMGKFRVGSSQVERSTDRGGLEAAGSTDKASEGVAAAVVEFNRILLKNYNEMRSALRSGQEEGRGRQGAELQLKVLERIMLSVDAQLAVLNSDEGMLAWAARRGAAALKASVRGGGLDLVERLEQLAGRLEEECVSVQAEARMRDAKIERGWREWEER